jgi:hypothetical protein
MVQELQRRFITDEHAVIYAGLAALSPKSPKFLDRGAIDKFALFYKITSNSQRLRLQVEFVEDLITLRATKPKTMLDMAVLLKSHGDAFAILFMCVAVALTLPVSSAGCERSFSCMARIKGKLRSTMQDTRLSDLGVISMHAPLTPLRL